MSADVAVRLAIQAAGTIDDGWETRVNMLVPAVAAMLRPPKDGQRSSSPMLVAQQVFDAQVIFGTYLSKHLDERSQRYVVSFQADNGDTPEELRTHRIDETAGAAMVLRLMQIKEGDRCAFFKYVDTVDRSTKVRYLVAIEKQPTKNARAATPPQRPRGSGAERPAAAPPQPAVEAPAPNQSKAAVIRGLLAELSEEQRLKAIDMLSKKGWATADEIPDAEFDKAMYIARHQREDYF